VCNKNNVTTKLIIYPRAMNFFSFTILFLFIWYFFNRQGYCPYSYVSSGVMRKSDLRSSLSLNVCVLNWFYVFFERFILIANKDSLRRWTLKRRFRFWKAEGVAKVLDLETISSDIWDEKITYIISRGIHKGTKITSKS